MRTLVVLFAAAVAGLAATPASAQEEGPRPNVVAFSEWKCPIGDIQEAVQLSNEISRPIHEAMVEEGLIVGWNILTHLYGDEWNLIFVTLAEDLDSAMASGAEFQRRLQASEDAERAGRFVELCPYHRDNIYTIQHGEDAEGM